MAVSAGKTVVFPWWFSSCSPGPVGVKAVDGTPSPQWARHILTPSPSVWWKPARVGVHLHPVPSTSHTFASTVRIREHGDKGDRSRALRGGGTQSREVIGTEKVAVFQPTSLLSSRGAVWLWDTCLTSLSVGCLLLEAGISVSVLPHRVPLLELKRKWKELFLADAK